MATRNSRSSGKHHPANASVLHPPVAKASPLASLPEVVKMELANPVTDAGMSELDRIASAVDMAIDMEDN